MFFSINSVRIITCGNPWSKKHFPFANPENDTHDQFRRIYTDKNENAGLKPGLHLYKSFFIYNNKNYRILIYSIKENLLADIKKMNLQMSDFYKQDKYGHSLIDYAWRYNQQGILDYFFHIILLHYSNLDKLLQYTDSHKNHLYHWAVKCNQSEYLQANIKDSKIMQVCNNKERNILHFACLSANIELVKMILEHHPDFIDTQDYMGNTPLMLAVCSLDLVRYLLSKEADINKFQYQGKCILHRACKLGAMDVIEYIVKNHPKLLEITSSDYAHTPLIDAIRYGQTDAGKYLIRNKANLQHADDEGNTALHWAAREKNMEIVKELIDCAASPYIENDMHELASDLKTDIEIYGLILLEQFIRSPNQPKSSSFSLANFFKPAFDEASLDAAQVLKAVCLGHMDNKKLEKYKDILQEKNLRYIYSQLKDYCASGLGRADKLVMEIRE